jgi:hypothetical protein
VGNQPRNRLGRSFVVVDVEGMPRPQATRELTNIGRNLCCGKQVCFVWFWGDRDKAARSVPMTDEQFDPIIAKSTGITTRETSRWTGSSF